MRDMIHHAARHQSCAVERSCRGVAPLRSAKNLGVSAPSENVCSASVVLPSFCGARISQNRRRDAVRLRSGRAGATKTVQLAKRMWSAAACRRCMPSRLAGTCCNIGPITNADGRLGVPRALGDASDRARQASPENSGGKPPHSTWCEATRDRSEWLRLAKHLRRACHAPTKTLREVLTS